MMEDTEPVRRSVTVRCRQKVNPDGTLLISKSLTVRTSHGTEQVYPCPQSLSSPPQRELYTARIAGVVLNESLRPRTRSATGLPAPGVRSFGSVSQSSTSQSSCRTTDQIPPRVSPHSDISGLPTPFFRSISVPASKASASGSHTESSVFNFSNSAAREKNLGTKSETTKYRHLQRTLSCQVESLSTGRCITSSHQQNGLAASARSARVIEVSNSTSSSLTEDEAEYTEHTTSTEYDNIAPLEPADNSGSNDSLACNQHYFEDDSAIPFYRSYSHEVFLNAPKLNSYGAVISPGIAQVGVEESATVERPIYFVDIRSQIYDISAILEASIEEEGIAPDGRGGDESNCFVSNDVQYSDGHVSRSSCASRTPSLSDGDLSINSLSIE